MKKLRRITLYAILSIGVLLAALTISFYLFKDRIINQFIVEANKHLNTPVRIGKFDVSIFEDFPNLSIVLTDVYVEDSHPGVYPLVTAGKVSFQISLTSIADGSYEIKGLKIYDSETSLKINAKGIHNYSVTKESDKSGKGLRLKLENVELRNTVFHYLDLKANQKHDVRSEYLNASIETSDDIYQIHGKGQVVTDDIQVSGTSYLKGKSFIVTTELLYDDVKKALTIKPSTLNIHQAAFEVTGTYAWKEKNLIDLKTNGKHTDIQTILSLFPEAVNERLARYQSNGDVYFRSHLKGELSARRKPAFEIEFGFNDATIFHPDLRSQIDDATMTGSFYASSLGEPSKMSLVLKDVKGLFNKEPFEGNFVLNDFSDPDVICNFKGKLDARSLLNFYPIEDLKEASGYIDADVSLEGKVGLLKNRGTAQQVSTQGTIDLHEINFVYGKSEIVLEDLNGNLQFSNNDLALSNVTGRYGHSDFQLNGFFKNIVTFVLFDNQPIGIETDLKAQHLNLNEIFDVVFPAQANATEDYTFRISPNVHLNFNCDIASLEYKRFRARHIAGDLLVKNEVAVSRHLSMETMGGAIAMSGIVDAKNHQAIDIVSTMKLSDVYVDSAFYVFENFRQNFIEDRHLKGRATAEVNLELTADQHLKLFPETLIADISVTIKNGQLNNFEPLKKLNKYLDDEGLNNLRFSDLKNDIHIERKTVFIPQMNIRSNVTDLQISGTHTFDQVIDYRVVTPLRRREIIDVDAAGAIEDSMEGKAKLFLKIVGTTDDYKVAYDTEAVKKKIASDIKREVQELKDAFRTKSKKKEKEKEVELAKDDYFDWSDQ